MTWVDLRDFVDYSPPDSAVRRAVDPDAWITGEVMLLRQIELGIRGLMWQQTEHGHKGINPPTPLPLLQAERDEEQVERAGLIPDRLDLDEIRKLIPMQRGGA